MANNQRLNKKLQDCMNKISVLNLNQSAKEVVDVCTEAIYIASQLKQPEVIAQLYFMRAKAKISKAVYPTKELREITMAPSWFAFALETQQKYYAKVKKKVDDIWVDTQKDLDKGFEVLKKKPIIGVVAVCYQHYGEVYGLYYMQTKLLLSKTRHPYIAKVANLFLLRKIRLGNYLIFDRVGLRRLREIEKDCLKKLNDSLMLFKEQEATEYLADSHIALAIEHGNFGNPIRMRYHKIKALNLIRKHKISRLESNIPILKRL